MLLSPTVVFNEKHVLAADPDLWIGPVPCTNNPPKRRWFQWHQHGLRSTCSTCRRHKRACDPVNAAKGLLPERVLGRVSVRMGSTRPISLDSPSVNRIRTLMPATAVPKWEDGGMNVAHLTLGGELNADVDLSDHSSDHEGGDTGREDNDSNEYLESRTHLVLQHIRNRRNG